MDIVEQSQCNIHTSRVLQYHKYVWFMFVSNCSFIWWRGVYHL